MNGWSKEPLSKAAESFLHFKKKKKTTTKKDKKTKQQQKRQRKKKEKRLESSFSGSLFYFPPCPACARTLPLSVPPGVSTLLSPRQRTDSTIWGVPSVPPPVPSPAGVPGGQPAPPPAASEAIREERRPTGTVPGKGDARGQSRSAWDTEQRGRSGAEGSEQETPAGERGGAFGLGLPRRWLPGKTSEELKAFLFIPLDSF